MMDILLYRRQFLLTRKPIPELDGWQRENIGGYVLHAHPDLQLTVMSDGNRKAALLGYFFDTTNPQASNVDILGSILRVAPTFDQLVAALKPYAGCYALLWLEGSRLKVIHDALALREVYYCEKENLVVCGSQPKILQRFASPAIVDSTNPDVQDFVKNHLPMVRDGRLWPGDGTRYEGVKHLLPNHYLEVAKQASHRYWPNAPLKSLSLEEAVSRSAAFLRGALKAAAHRQKLMMAVTAGFDSRTLLAASKDLKDSVYFFINQHKRLSDDSNDIRVPREIFKGIDVPFHIHKFSTEVSDTFRKTFYENSEYAHEAILPAIYNVYYKQHSEKMNILGVGEVGRTKFFADTTPITSYYMAYMLCYRKSKYAVAECQKWIDQSESIARKCGLNPLGLFWWEVLLGTWGSVGNAESDIAIEEFDPFCSHYLYETFLSLDVKYRTPRDNVLFRELIRHMWPELLRIPVNPAAGFKDWRDDILDRIGLEKAAKSLKYNVHKLCYHAWWQKRDGNQSAQRA